MTPLSASGGTLAVIMKNENVKQDETEKIIAEIKTKLKGKSYKEISEILSTVSYELSQEIIY